MKVSFKGLMILTMTSIGLSACATTDMQNIMSSGSVVSEQKLNPISPQKVKIYYGNSNIPKHRVIGRISVESYNIVGMEYSQAQIAEEMKKQAASIGANGVINVSSGLAQTTGDAIVIRKKK